MQYGFLLERDVRHILAQEQECIGELELLPELLVAAIESSGSRGTRLSLWKSSLILPASIGVHFR